MGWASFHIEALQRGETVKFRPKGNSMTPRVNSGQLCTVAPVRDTPLAKGDVVLCKVNGRQFLHLVLAVNDKQALIGNNHGHTNGWCTLANVYGRLILVEP